MDYLPTKTALLVRTMQIDIPNRVQKAIEDRDAGIMYERPTIMGGKLDSDLSPDEKRPTRVANDALAVVGAGVRTILLLIQAQAAAYPAPALLHGVEYANR